MNPEEFDLPTQPLELSERRDLEQELEHDFVRIYSGPHKPHTLFKNLDRANAMPALLYDLFHGDKTHAVMRREQFFELALPWLESQQAWWLKGYHMRRPLRMSGAYLEEKRNRTHNKDFLEACEAIGYGEDDYRWGVLLQSIVCDKSREIVAVLEGEKIITL